jgi:hypothetical protein
VARLVLLRRGGPAEPGEVARLLAVPGLRVLAETAGRIMLVDGDEPAIRAAVEAMPNWVVGPATGYPPPGSAPLD